jgi:hypothetical protein
VPTTAQIDAIYGPQSDGTSYVQRSDHGATFGDRADFNFVEDNIPLEQAAAKPGSNGLMVNHPGFDFMVWQINPAAVPPPLNEAALGHVTPSPHDLNLPGYNAASFRTVDVVSLIARYADMDVGPATGKWSPRQSALDYLLQFSADGTNWVGGTPVAVFDQGWTDQSQAEDFLARWESPVDAKFVRIQADTQVGQNDRNTQIDAVIAAPAGPLDAVGDTVFVLEGQSGTSTFTVYNFGAAATITGINVVQQPTAGDPTDFANMTGVGGTCVIGNILPAGGQCTVVVDFMTDTFDQGPPFDGLTPFDLTFLVDDGRTAAAIQQVIVSDAEPASLALLAFGVGTLGALRGRSRRNSV